MVESTYGPDKTDECTPRSTSLFVPIGQRAVVAAEVRIAGVPTRAGFFVAVGEHKDLYTAGKMPFSPDKAGTRRRELRSEPMDAFPWRISGGRPVMASTDNFVLLGPSLVGDDMYVTHRCPDFSDRRIDPSMTDHFGYVAMIPARQEGKDGMALQIVMPDSPYLGAGLVHIETQRTPTA